MVSNTARDSMAERTAGSETAESSVPTIWSNNTANSSRPTSYTDYKLAYKDSDAFLQLPEDKADDFIEESTNTAGKATFACKWPSCMGTKMWWNSRSEIKNHMMRHSKPYGCTFDQCYSRFGSKSDWIEHEVKQHFQQVHWRCDLANPSSTFAKSCWEIFQSEERFVAHLENVHHMPDAREVTGNLRAQQADARHQPQYWCGFCKSIRLARKKDRNAYAERYDHIAEHISVEGRCMDDWVPPEGKLEGTLAEQALRRRGELVTEAQDEATDSSIDLPSSEDAINVGARIPPVPGQVLSWESPTSVAQRRKGLEGQIESTDFLMSQRGSKANEVTANRTQESAQALIAPRTVRSNSSLQVRERSMSQSNKLESRDSEGEREFMSPAVEGRGNAGLSPRSAMDGDQEVIASIVVQIVQAYLRVLVLQQTDSRQAANSSNTCSGRTPGGEISIPAASKKGERTNSAKDRKRARQGDDDIEDDDNPSKRIKIDDEASGNRSFACPYSKHNKMRYWEMNTDMREQNYRRCTSKYLTDIPRLKQHLYRTHKRPDSYCGRCFGTFTSQNNLEEHSRTHPPCTVVVCPFPEKMTHDQKIIIKRRRDAKDQAAVWFFVYETLFPGSTKPESPYVEIMSAEAAASFQHWYESTEAVANFRENVDSRVAEAFPDTSVQFRVQMIVEEALSELVFHSVIGDGRLPDQSDPSILIPGSGGSEQPFEDTGSQYPGVVVLNTTTPNEPAQSDSIQPSFSTSSRRENIPGYTADNGTDLTTQQSLSQMDMISRADLEAVGEAKRPPPSDYLQDTHAFDTMAPGHELDHFSFTGYGLFTIDPSDLEEVACPNAEHPSDDNPSSRRKGKFKACQ